ncbi:hypothetical protein NDU88_001804 [Pleurodeles waltl]|uniref:Uncharacterized protein n=1 Tax=Pleurodeles waltl TaxID=8319 RepID=A0AAV7RDV8_PLEWA|nr:hypothetical protein NDU88_001804 [Pleurodeles waltl]
MKEPSGRREVSAAGAEPRELHHGRCFPGASLELRGKAAVTGGAPRSGQWGPALETMGGQTSLAQKGTGRERRRLRAGRPLSPLLRVLGKPRLGDCGAVCGAPQGGKGVRRGQRVCSRKKASNTKWLSYIVGPCGGFFQTRKRELLLSGRSVHVRRAALSLDEKC